MLMPLGESVVIRLETKPMNSIEIDSMNIELSLYDKTKHSHLVFDLFDLLA